MNDVSHTNGTSRPGQQSGPLWSLDGASPRIAPDAWIAPNATIIGNVEVGAGASIWFNCVLRGDTNIIRIGARSNIQDGSILHVNPGAGMAAWSATT